MRGNLGEALAKVIQVRYCTDTYLLCAQFPKLKLAPPCYTRIGGPLIVEGNSMEEDFQVGVVSWGIGCAEPGYPGELTS